MMPNAGGTLALASDIPTVTPMYLHCTSFADAPISTGYGGIVSGTIYTISSSSTSITTSTFYSAVGDKLWFNGYVRVDTSDAGYDYCTFLAGIFQYQSQTVAISFQDPDKPGSFTEPTKLNVTRVTDKVIKIN